MDNLINSGYEVGHQAFLQAIMARGSLTFEEARPIIAAIREADGEDVRPDQVTEEDFHDYIDKASQAASLFDFEIRSVVHQVTRERVYAFVNTASDPQTQLATTFSPDELSFIKRLFDAMFETYNTPRTEIMAITELQAMKLARPSNRRPSPVDGAEATQPVDRGLKHSEVENVMASLLVGGWLELSRDAYYSLSPRALLELRPWLLETYNDEGEEWQRIKLCEACKELITVGLKCEELTCLFRIHDSCSAAFWRVRSDSNCPKCSTPWSGGKYVGERAVTMTGANARGHRRTVEGNQGRRSSGMASSSRLAEDEESEEDSDESDE